VTGIIEMTILAEFLLVRQLIQNQQYLPLGLRM